MGEALQKNFNQSEKHKLFFIRFMWLKYCLLVAQYCRPLVSISYQSVFLFVLYVFIMILLLSAVPEVNNMESLKPDFKGSAFY